ncbi:MAG: AraC family transcriptional regulator [Pseudomonadota bacterium]
MKVPSYRLRPTNNDIAGCIESWREARRDLHDVLPVAGDFSNSYFRTSSYRVDNIVFSKTRMRNLILQRRDRHLHDDESSFLRVRLFETDGAVNLSDGTPTKTNRGQISVLDYSRASDMVTTDMLQIGVYVPHAAIGYDTRKHPTDICLNAGTSAARILANAIRSYYAELHELDVDHAAQVASSFTGMLAGLVDGGAMSHDERSVRRARVNAMCNFLEHQLKDPSLSISALEKSFGASRATIFRDFSDYGGVGKYIQARRLERAFSELSDASPRRGVVTSVAEAWGFTSSAHFNRLFRARYGFSPGSAVGLRAQKAEELQANDAQQPEGSADMQGDAGTLRGWLDTL